jgi:hypothetical protein
MRSIGTGPTHHPREALQTLYIQNTNRLIYLLPKFAVAYNETMHSTTGMALAAISVSNEVDI